MGCFLGKSHEAQMHDLLCCFSKENSGLTHWHHVEDLHKHKPNKISA